MTTPLAELRTILARPAPTTGILVSLNGATAEIATAQGLLTAQTSATLTPGDPVRIDRGIAYPRAVPSARYRL